MSELIKLDRIRTDGGTQTRAKLCDQTVQDYAEALDSGELPPITAFDDGEYLWMGDGFHRKAAYALKGREEIPCNILRGTVHDALLYSAGCNIEHGLRRTAEDKRKAIELILAVPEWAERSDRWIAEVCKVSDKTVAAVRTNAEFRSSRNDDTENDATSTPPKRKGKDGKFRPAAKTEPEVVLCAGCQRMKRLNQAVPERCPECKELRGSKPAPARGKAKSISIAPAFNDHTLDKALDKLIGYVQDRGHHFDGQKECADLLTKFTAAWKRWQEKKPGSKPDKKSEPIKRFSIPTLEEVTAYCKERKNDVNPEQFVDHYTSNGWKVGRNPMRDWKGAVRNWEKNDLNRNGKAKPKMFEGLKEFLAEAQANDQA